MRAHLAAGILVLLLCVAPAWASAEPRWVVTSARMDTVFDPSLDGADVGSHHRFEFTVRNDGGEGYPWAIGIDAWWLVTELPTTLWSEEPVTLAPGESRTWVVDDPTAGLWFTPGPMWLCVRAEWSGNGWPSHCWSAIVGAAHPDAYPENIPWPLMPETPMGDVE